MADNQEFAYDALMAKRGFQPSGLIDGNHYYFNASIKMQVMINVRNNVYCTMDAFGNRINTENLDRKF